MELQYWGNDKVNALNYNEQIIFTVI
jgi:hypothetical protein